MRLRAKLALLLGGLAAVVTALTVSLLYMSERRHLLTQMEAAQASAVEKFAEVCRNSTVAEDELARLTYLRALWQASESAPPAYAAFLDMGGRFVMHSDFLSGDFERRGKPAAEPELRAAAASPAPLRQESGAGSEALLVFSSPVKVYERRLGTAALAYRAAAFRGAAQAAQRGSRLRLLQAGSAALVLSGLLAFGLARTLTLPIAGLRLGAQRIGKGEFAHRIPADRGDELGDLAREFNSMGAKLAELDELKETFVAQVTHDLRGPLSSVMGHIELVLMGIRDPIGRKSRESLVQAMTSAHYLNALIEEILDVTRLQAGLAPLEPGPRELREAVSEVLDMLATKASEFGVRLDSQSVLEGTKVRADAQALKRILSNLVSNALKFTPKGGTVSVAWGRAESGEDWICVRDTGIGIPEEQLHRLFKKFSQVAEAQDKVRPSKGFGLGLVICKQLVEAHGGRIWVESASGQGSSFFFTLPPISS